MNNAAPVSPSYQTTQLFLSTAPSSAEHSQVLRLAGQDVTLVLLKNGPDGAKLELPSGHVITAKGDLPFPEQTRLQVRVTVEDGSVRLRTLEAIPPPSVSVLAPLEQSEASALIRQLSALKIPDALLPLAKLFAEMVPLKEIQLLHAIESLPIPTQQLLSSLLGLKTNDPALLLNEMLEQFEPNKQLFESIISELLSKMIYLRGESVQNSNTGFNKTNIVENMMQALKLLPKDVYNNLSFAVLGRNDSDVESLVKALIEKINIGNKDTIIASKDNVASSADAKINSQKLTHLLENIPVSIKKDIASAIVGFQEAESKTIAKFIIQQGITPNVVLSHNSNMEITSLLRQILSFLPENFHCKLSNEVLGKNISDIETLIKAIIEKHDTANKDITIVSKENLLNSTDTKENLQKTIKLLENLPVSIKKIIISAVTNSSNTEPKAAAEFLIQQKIISSGNTPETSLLRQILSFLPNDVHKEISNNIFNRIEPDLDIIIKAIIEKSNINPKNTSVDSMKFTNSDSLEKTSSQNTIKLNAIIEKSNINSKDTSVDSIKFTNSDSLEKPSSQAAIKLLDNMPIFIKRAIASAFLETVNANSDTIADLLIQKGINSNIKQDFVLKLDTVSPILRQIIAIFAELPLNASSEQIYNAILNKDRAVFEMAKAILALDTEQAPTKSDSKSDYLLNDKTKNDPVVAYTDRLNYLLQFEMRNSLSDFSQQDKNSISSWFRSIVDQFIIAKSVKSGMPETSPFANLLKLTPNSPKTINTTIEQATSQNAAAIGEKATTWQNWLKGSMKALVDSTVFSKEAAFHTLTAKENINYFELPIPWMQGRALEMWIEEDNENNKKDNQKATHRILLSLNFSSLGETRVGLESIAKRLNIRIWAENPQPVENEVPSMQDTLSALGFDAQVSIHTLTTEQDGSIPSIKSVIKGPSLHAMG